MMLNQLLYSNIHLASSEICQRERVDISEMHAHSHLVYIFFYFSLNKNLQFCQSVVTAVFNITYVGTMK